MKKATKPKAKHLRASSLTIVDEEGQPRARLNVSGADLFFSMTGKKGARIDLTVTEKGECWISIASGEPILSTKFTAHASPSTGGTINLWDKKGKLKMGIAGEFHEAPRIMVDTGAKSMVDLVEKVTKPKRRKAARCTKAKPAKPNPPPLAGG